MSLPSDSPTGWPRGRWQWLLGSIVIFGLGILFGLIIQNVWLGVMVAVVVSISWLIAYESWRHQAARFKDPDDNGARL